MKALLAAVGGLAFGVVAACSCPPNPDHPKLQSGSYLSSGAEPDYQLTIASDVRTMTESFTRGGKKYQLVYSVTSTQEFE